MTVESATYISDLNTSYPTGSNAKYEGDNHIRLVKTTLKTTFPNVTGAVTAAHTELNYTVGVTSNLQYQLDLKAPLANPTFTGTMVGAYGVFSGTVNVATPTSNGHAATKLYVDSQAFAAALPAQTGNARKVVSTDGANAAWGQVFGAGSLVSTTTAGQVRQRYNVDTSSAGWTLTLPSSPAADDWVWIVDVGGACATKNLTVARNGSTIMNLAEDLTVDVNYASVLLIYDTTKGWVLS